MAQVDAHPSSIYDPGLRRMVRNLLTEEELLLMYNEWVRDDISEEVLETNAERSEARDWIEDRSINFGTG